VTSYMLPMLTPAASPGGGLITLANKVGRDEYLEPTEGKVFRFDALSQAGFDLGRRETGGGEDGAQVGEDVVYCLFARLLPLSSNTTRLTSPPLLPREVG
jgi:hypothetical protein